MCDDGVIVELSIGEVRTKVDVEENRGQRPIIVSIISVSEREKREYMSTCT